MLTRQRVDVAPSLARRSRRCAPRRAPVSRDHVHLLVSIPSSLSVNRLVQWLKGKSLHVLLTEFAHLHK